ncbi:MAG: hypothetical protein K2Y27_12330 [Xanthobacteraceae bacterium]|nr:hypothetical protein [Xanthobacteraceae bacterium]
MFWVSDWSAPSAAASEIFLPSLALVLLLLLCGVVLSSLRLKLITAVGYTLTFRDAAFTLSIGQLAGTDRSRLDSTTTNQAIRFAAKPPPPAPARAGPH